MNMRPHTGLLVSSLIALPLPLSMVSGCSNGAGATLTLPANPVVLMDWNGDKKTDLLVNHNGFFGVYQSTG